ncbi:PepSY-associated TM helix domain-containing protein [Thiohalorhabdus sp.]|uniref:PepSY-associated TM helix domain-containing protein n=1 Tax=Thiohalorhabdus sp. TaxID=3094134 RepID=UPI002FC29CCF
MNRTWLLLHRWTGLGLGLFLAIQGLLGAWLVVAEPLDEWLHPELLQSDPRPGAEPLGLAEAHAAVNAAYPDRPLWLLVQPEGASGVYRAVLEGRHGPRVYVDPYSGEVSEQRAAFATLEAPVRVLHTGEIGGAALETVVGVLAVVLLALAITGLVVWWPGRGRLRQALGFSTASLADLARDGHRWAGLVGLPFLGLIAATGIYLVFHHAVQDAVFAVTGEEEAEPVPLAADAGPMPAGAVGDMVDAARAAVPGAAITFLVFPTEPGESVRARLRYPDEWHPNGNSEVQLHPRGARVLGTYDHRAAGPGEYAMDHLYPLHIGTYGGTAARTAHFVAGLLPALFFATGLYLWWRRRRARARRRRPAKGAGAQEGRG